MIGLIFEKGEEWYFEQLFEEIKEFRETGIYSITKPEQSDGYVGIYVQEYDFEEPQEFQINAINYFYYNQQKVLNKLCDSVIKHYSKLMEMYDVTDYDAELGFPELKSINEVKKIIGIGNIHVFYNQKDNLSYLGFECGCPWDEEHGLGIIMHTDRVIDVGTADICFSGSKELRKDNGTYSNEQKIRDEEIEK